MIITLEFQNQNIVDTVKLDVDFIKALEKYELWIPKPGHIDGTIIIVCNQDNLATDIVLKNISDIILTHIKRLFPAINSMKINDGNDFEQCIIIDGQSPMVFVTSKINATPK